MLPSYVQAVGVVAAVLQLLLDWHEEFDALINRIYWDAVPDPVACGICGTSPT